jgi:hypothetical protein
MGDLLEELVAHVHRAREPVIHVGRNSRGASHSESAALLAIAEDAIITRYGGGADAASLKAAVHGRARIPIVAGRLVGGEYTPKARVTDVICAGVLVVAIERVAPTHARALGAHISDGADRAVFTRGLVVGMFAPDLERADVIGTRVPVVAVEALQPRAARAPQAGVPQGARVAVVTGG